MGILELTDQVTLHDALDAALKAEHRALHREACDVAEEGHIDFLETEIDLLVRIGEASSGDLNARPADGVSRGPWVQDLGSAGRAGGSRALRAVAP